MKKNQSGEIATLVTIGTLIILGVSSLVSTVFLKNKQTTRSKAAESCPGKVDQAGACNPACCADDSQCPSGEKCSVPNGYCLSGKSCQATTQPNPTTSATATETPAQSNPTKPPNVGGFHLTSDVYAGASGQDVSFNVHIKFNSDGCDGHINLFRDGAHVAGTNVWDKTTMGSFDFNENFAGRFTVKKGQSLSPTYRGTVDHCPNSEVTLEDTVQCTLSVDGNGRASVRGSGCSCNGCDQINPSNPPSQPTPTQASGPTSPPAGAKTPAPTKKVGTGPPTRTKKETPTGATSTPTSTPVQAVGKCTDNSVHPYEPGVDCPDVDEKSCTIRVADTDEPGTRYRRILCGKNKDDFCQLSCKKANDLGTGNYSGNCTSDDTCMTIFFGGVSKITATISTSLINCEGKAKITAIGVLITDGESEKPVSKSYNPPVTRNIQENFSLSLNKIPQRDIKFDAFINVEESGRITAVRAGARTQNSLSLKDMPFQINYQCP